MVKDTAIAHVAFSDPDSDFGSIELRIHTKEAKEKWSSLKAQGVLDQDNLFEFMYDNPDDANRIFTEIIRGYPEIGIGVLDLWESIID